MLDAIAEHWDEADLEDRLHLERFSLALGDSDAEGGVITFQNSSKTAEVDGATTLLEAGEEAGIGMPYGCRMGICHTCTLTLVKGAVKDLRNGEEFTQPNEQMQTCVTAADGRLHARHLIRDPTPTTTTTVRNGRAMAISDVKEYTHLTEDEVEQIGRELDAIRAEIEESRGDADAAYINRLIKIQRGLAAAGRVDAAVHQQEAGAGSPAPPCWASRRSSRTWRSATTSCTASGTG